MVSNLWFKRTQYILSFGRFYKIWADVVGMSDCEESYWGNHRRWWRGRLL